MTRATPILLLRAFGTHIASCNILVLQPQIAPQLFASRCLFSESGLQSSFLELENRKHFLHTKRSSVDSWVSRAKASPISCLLNLHRDFMMAAGCIAVSASAREQLFAAFRRG